MRARGWLTALLLVGLSAPVGAYALPNEVVYQIDARLDPDAQAVIGHQTVTVTNRTGRPLEELYFHVVPNAFRRGANSHYQQDLRRAGIDPDRIYADPADDAFMEIRQVALIGQTASVEVGFEVTDTLMRVALPRPLAEGATVTVAIAFLTDLMEVPFQGRLAARWAIRSGHRMGVYTIAKWYPQLVVYDQAGWHLDPYRLLGEFYGDFADYVLRLTVPSGFEVGATGTLAAVSENPDGTRTLTFHAQDVHDVAWVASDRFRVHEVFQDGVLVRTLYLDRPQIGALAADALRFFSERFGAYPYPVFTVAQVEVGGGMEYPGIVMIGLGGVFEVSHEVAHQWWYAVVGNDEFEEPWLDEATATFSSELYRILARGEPPSIRQMTDFVEPGIPVLSPSTAFPSLSALSATVYTKGSGVLWMLRALVGTQAFDDALRTYYERFRFRNATTDDLIAVIQEVTQQDLAWFFDQWLRTTKTLDFSLDLDDGVEVSRRADGSFESAFTVRRDGEAVMPLTVRVTLADGTQRDLNWDGRAREHTFTLSTPAAPVEIRLDPDVNLLEEARQNNLWVAHETPSWLPVVAGLVALGTILGLRRRLSLTRAEHPH